MTELPEPELYAEEIDDFGQLATSAKRFLGKVGPRWTPLVTHSRGPVVTSREWTGRIADCVMVCLRDDTGGGALATFLNGKYTDGFTWLWCTECSGSGFEHAANTPKAIGYRDLCRLVSEV